MHLNRSKNYLKASSRYILIIWTIAEDILDQRKNNTHKRPEIKIRPFILGNFNFSKTMKIDWTMVLAVVIGMIVYKLVDRFFLEGTIQQLEGDGE